MDVVAGATRYSEDELRGFGGRPLNHWRRAQRLSSFETPSDKHRLNVIAKIRIFSFFQKLF